MKKTKLTQFLICAVCLLCICGCTAAAYQISVLKDTQAKKEASIKQIETFIQSGEIEKFTNNKAIEKFGIQANIESNSVNALPVKASYQSPEGFTIKSFSKSWDETKLKLLRDELLKNKHGKELDYLSEIRIYPQGDGSALAAHDMDKKASKFRILFPALPSFFEVPFYRQVGTIYLYGGEKNTTVESMAKSLSHEYGHHFTFYHMFEEGDLSKSQYAKLRALNDERVKTSSTPGTNYLKEHHWYLFEIAAEDYVYLMGSPTIKRICEAKDTKQLLAGAKEPDTSEYYQCANVDPQENLMIPAANDVKGLAEYFYSFTSEKAPVPASEKKEIKINIEKGQASYNLVGGRKTFTHYKVTWNTPYDDPNAVYTLLRFGSYEGDYYIDPVKTVRSGQGAVAYVGDVTATSGNSVHYYTDPLTSGTQYFIVSVQLSDGTVYLSEPLTYNFG